MVNHKNLQKFLSFNFVRPVRVQRKRSKGWKMPENTVYVGRPTKWGNPFKLVGDTVYIDASHRRKVLNKWVYLCQGDVEKVVRLYKCVVTGFMQIGDYGIEIDSLKDISVWVKHFRSQEFSILKGKNLACFCPITCSCHADILLEIVNVD